MNELSDDRKRGIGRVKRMKGRVIGVASAMLRPVSMRCLRRQWSEKLFGEALA